ncbi:MAG: glycoside hydrolase family 25 protein [Bacteroidetes bacterium]|nr:glycoside hydrolase family 25 protein [Bacteroidota bacterium]
MARRRKNKNGKILLFSIVCFVLIAIFIVVITEIFNRKQGGFIHYAEFGINIPQGYSIHGIDVSKYQSQIAWEQVKAMRIKNINPGFAFIKATEGASNFDPQFDRNWANARSAGVVRGAYHFFIATKDGNAQAGNFINKVELKSGDIPPVLDIEQLNGATPANLKKEAKRWLDSIENYYDVRPIIYTNVDFYNHYLGAEFDKYPLWVAHYYQPQQPRINRDWLFWQHNDAGRVNGIGHPVDFNVFNGDSLAFKDLLVK